MSVKLTELQSKEVICLSNGQRLGCITDVLVEMPEGKICAVIVPGPCRYLGLVGRQEDYVLPWDSIRRIGPDIVLVDTKPEDCRVHRNKPGRLF